LAVDRQVVGLLQVLPQQAIGILIRSALPWILGIAEIDLNIGRQSKALVVTS
jgi:hypothetical protein